MSDERGAEAIRKPTHPTESAPSPEEHQEGPGIAMGKVVLVGVISVLVFAAGSIWSYGIYRSTAREMNPAGRPQIPAEMGREEIGIVDQVPFELNRWVSQHREQYANEKGTGRLQTYGWVDRKAGTVRIPIDRAMELLVQEQAKEPQK